MEQTLVLYYIYNLCLHWIYVEYERCTESLGRTVNGNRVTEEAASKRRSSMHHTVQNSKVFNIFPPNTNNCQNPLKSLLDLTEMFGRWVDTTMATLTKYRPHHDSYQTTDKYHAKNESASLEVHVFANEVLFMYHVVRT